MYNHPVEACLKIVLMKALKLIVHCVITFSMFKHTVLVFVFILVFISFAVRNVL